MEENKEELKDSDNVSEDIAKGVSPTGPDGNTEHGKKRSISISNDLVIEATKEVPGSNSDIAIDKRTCKRRCEDMLLVLKNMKEEGYTHVIGIFEEENPEKSDPVQPGEERFRRNIISGQNGKPMLLDDVARVIFNNYKTPQAAIRELQVAIENASIWSNLDSAIVTLAFHGGFPASFAFISPEASDAEVRMVGDINEEQTDTFKDAMRRQRRIVFQTDKVVL